MTKLEAKKAKVGNPKIGKYHDLIEWVPYQGFNKHVFLNELFESIMVVLFTILFETNC